MISLISKKEKKENSGTSEFPHRIGLYIRVSTEEQAENPEGSIRSQEQRLRNHIDLLRNSGSLFGEVAAVYVDRARSGKDTNRPELQKMLAAIRRKEVTLIMVSELSRLSRSIKDFCSIWELMSANGCKFQSLREQFDTTNAAGEMVLFTIANIAQFERKQVAERVTANLQARSMRGLYNGGIVPLGYQTVDEKKGHLEINQTEADLVKTVFDQFLKNESIADTAKWLNDNGFALTRKMRNGGNKPRLGHFTVSNLQYILRNKAYIGIKTHKTNGTIKEARAVWPAIIEENQFKRVQELLDKNFINLKCKGRSLYSFSLSGLIFCESCGERLSGKSAYGNGGKIPYYDHGWALKRQACLKDRTLNCKPTRVLAKAIEPLVWDKLSELLSQPEFAKSLIQKAQINHSKDTKSDEANRVRGKIHDLGEQISALVERISELPKGLPAEPFYQQMGKLIDQKKQEELRLKAILDDEGYKELPAELPQYSALLSIFSQFANDPMIMDAKAAIIQRLISKVVITPNSYRLYFHVGRDYIDGELDAATRFFKDLSKKKDLRKSSEVLDSEGLTTKVSEQIYFGSSGLRNGWGTRIRT